MTAGSEQRMEMEKPIRKCTAGAGCPAVMGHIIKEIRKRWLNEL
jgi:hypothetical protein